METIPCDCVVKLTERMPRVCKAVIKVNGGYDEESKIKDILVYLTLFCLQHNLCVPS